MSGFAHNGHGALADERDGDGMGPHALARDAAGGVEVPKSADGGIDPAA